MTCKMRRNGMRGRDLWNSSNSRFDSLGLPEASGDHRKVSTADKRSSEET